MTSTDYPPPPTLLTAKQFSERHDWPLGGLRDLMFRRPDGFDRVLRHIGRKVLIHEREFFAWVEEINASSKGGRDVKRR